MKRLVCLAVWIAAADAQAAAPPRSSAAFLATIGVDTHMAYTDGLYANFNQVIADLQYLGITTVRDGISNGYNPITGVYNGSAPLSTYQTLAAAGVQFTFVTSGGGAMTPAVLDTVLGQMQTVAMSTPGSVLALEGPNEINNFPLTWNGGPDATCPEELAAAKAFQRTLYADVTTNTAFTGAKLVMFTGAPAYLTQDSCQLAAAPNIAKVKGYANWDNQHPYPRNGDAPAAYLNPAHAVPGNTAPLVYTETGYNTDGGTYAGVNAYVQGAYGLDLFFDAAHYGVLHTYWYDLLDAYAPGSPQGDDGYGLFDYQGNAKPLAVALHNLHAILQDTGTSPLRTPHFTTSGLPASGTTLALGRQDGSDGDFVLWAEPPLWNPATGTQLSASPSTVTVSLGKTYASVSVFDPTIGSAATQTLAKVATVTVSLLDHPLIIRAR